MDRLKMQSCDVVGGNVAKIAALFPQCVTERINKDGKAEFAIDFEKLRAELSNEVIGEGEERYQFTWPDKRAASRLANEPTTMTLRPCREESVDFDHTENLYIEGDNLDVLKVLRETYLGKVKMIYIDPPYNTGKDFVYNDDFSQGKETFERQSGLFDEEENQTLDPMQRNTEANGRFHTDWLNMIYPRLKTTRDLLESGGVIFISIDDNEIDNLKKLCDEIFGAQNFIDVFCWAKTETPENLSIKSRQVIEYVLCYQKDKDSSRFKGLQKYSSSSNGLLNQPNAIGTLVFPANKVTTRIPDGIVKAGMYGTKKYAVELLNDVRIENGIFISEFSLRAKFKWSQSKLDEEIANGTSISIPTMNFSPAYDKAEYAPEVPTNYISNKVGVETNENAGEYQLSLFDKKVFNFPKPVSLIKYLLGFTDNPNESYVVLDFFSGSATTAQAVMELNIGRDFPIKYIMVQIQEDLRKTLATTKEQSQKEIVQNAIDFCTEQNVPANICEIAKERIRRAGKKIIADLGAMSSAYQKQIDTLTEQIDSASLFKNSPSTTQIEEKITPIKEEQERIEKSIRNLNTGFRVLKLDSSNMEEVYYTPDKFDPSLLDGLVDNIKADRTSEDLLFQVMLDLGIELSAKIQRKEIAGKEVFSVDEDYLLACFDKDVNETTIEEMAKLYPTHLVIRDASATNDNVLDNFDQIIAIYSNEKKITCHVL